MNACFLIARGVLLFPDVEDIDPHLRHEERRREGFGIQNVTRFRGSGFISRNLFGNITQGARHLRIGSVQLTWGLTARRASAASSAPSHHAACRANDPHLPY